MSRHSSPPLSSFPRNRPRRLRRNASIRELVRETHLTPSALIAPLFVVEGDRIEREIGSMPGQFQRSVDRTVEHCKKLVDLGISSVILFGIPGTKDEVGSSGCDKNGIVPRTVRQLKSALPKLNVITDLCFCEYTSHGHCGILNGHDVDNDKTLKIISDQALAHLEAGADIIAPSGMIDGAVITIRQTLDENGGKNIPIMAYAAKFASGYYGPFREAAESAPEFGDRNTYQMDPANTLEALREVALDIEEGADIVMVKPALAYLDIIQRVKDTFGLPTAAYNVSGEYSMIKAAGKLGWIDAERVMNETLLSMKRAGADIILTYFAEEFARSYQ